MSLFVSDMPTNFACPRQPTFPRPTKRPLSFDMEQYLHEPVHKVYISEKFANDLAAMSLNHREERRPPEPFTVATTTKDIPEYQAYVIDEEGLSQPGKDPKSVVVVDDINDFLSSDDEQPDDNSMDTDYTLPMQKRPGDSKYRIPDFVLQSDQGPKSLREFVLGRKSPESNTKPKEKHVIVLNSDRLTPAMHIDGSDNPSRYTFDNESHYAGYSDAALASTPMTDTDVASMDVD